VLDGLLLQWPQSEYTINGAGEEEKEKPSGKQGEVSSGTYILYV